MTVLKAKRFRKRGVYRLEGAGPGGSPVIAKICKRKTAEVESLVYEELLPRLPMPSLRYYGKVPDDDRQHCWLFLEDAGAERYSPADPEHRRLAARWLATVQLHAAEFVAHADLPDRGPRHYLVHLLNAREEIAQAAAPPQRCTRRRPGAGGPAVQARPARVALGRADRLLRHASPDARPRRPRPEEPSHHARRAATPGSRSSTGRPPASGFRLPTWHNCWSPSAPQLARLRAVEAVLPVLREPLPRHLPLRARRLRRGAGRARPSSNRRRSASLFRCLAGIDWTCMQAHGRLVSDRRFPRLLGMARRRDAGRRLELSSAAVELTRDDRRAHGEGAAGCAAGEVPRGTVRLGRRPRRLAATAQGRRPSTAGRCRGR